MNTTVSLTIEQETNRAIKGHHIFSQNLVEQISDYEYIVKGKYYIEYFPLSEAYTCNCADHSFRQVRCAHIIAVEFLRIGA